MQEENINRKPRFWLYILFILAILYLIRSPLIFKSATSPNPGSAQVNTSPSLSLDNSYIFSSPIRAKANGEQIRITVYILNDRGIGMPGKAVSIGGGNVLQVKSVQPITDNQGRATFDISGAGSPGVYIIQAMVDGAVLVQKITIYFD